MMDNYLDPTVTHPGLFLFNKDNSTMLEELSAMQLLPVNLIYADMMFKDNVNLGWISDCYEALYDTGSIYIHTDQHSVAEVKLELDRVFGKENFVNWIIWNYDWGGRPKNAYGRKHDDILWYSKSKNYKFYPERVQIPKKTAKTGFNKSGRTTKTPTDVWDHIGNFHTMSKERVKLPSGTNIPWQKPKVLLEQVILPCTDEFDTVLDPFMGTGTTGYVAFENWRYFAGFEYNPEIFEIARARLFALQNHMNGVVNE